MSLIAVLIDAMSIQKYIFSSNYLKENLGASFIVEDIYESHLKEVIGDIFPKIDKEKILEEWKKNPEKIIINDENAEFEVGYIGGGNALLFFKNRENAERFVKKWSTRLLIMAPGLITVFAMSEFELGKFSASIERLFELLRNNKNSFIAETTLKRHGITAECRRTGLSMDVWCNQLPEEERDKYISSVSNAKILAAALSKKKVQTFLDDLGLSENYIFTDELERLGQRKGEDSHIAIVHIDGNDMGKRFQEQKDLVDIRKLSKSVKDATERSFKNLIKEICNKFVQLKDEFNFYKENNKYVLPIRPIVIGGDDVTFVTDGRLGIYFAKIFVENFERQSVSDGKPLTACAGVSITKTRYPFYRGYELSEELCKFAKKERRNKNDNGSWIDWHIVYSGFSGSLTEIRDSQYKVGETSNSQDKVQDKVLKKHILMRPYKLDDLNELISSASRLVVKDEKGKRKFPHSKLMKLKQILYLPEVAQQLFVEDLKIRGHNLPDYKSFNNNKIFVDNTTPYYDMIDLTELYPECLLVKGGKNEGI